MLPHVASSRRGLILHNPGIKHVNGQNKVISEFSNFPHYSLDIRISTPSLFYCLYYLDRTFYKMFILQHKTNSTYIVTEGREEPYEHSSRTLKTREYTLLSTSPYLLRSSPVSVRSSEHLNVKLVYLRDGNSLGKKILPTRLSIGVRSRPHRLSVEGVLVVNVFTNFSLKVFVNN